MCEGYDWQAIDAARWHEVPFIERRLATEEDVRCGRAVFYVTGIENQAVDGFKLPSLAELTNEDGTVETVIIIQIEASSSEDLFIVGFRYLGGGNGVGTLPEFKIIDD